MRILRQAASFRRIPGPVFLAAGFFDGVHKGHQLVLDSTVERAREVGGQAWVLTFDRHPLAVLAPSKCPPLLCTLEERLHRLEQSGVDGVLLLPFTRKLAVREPETFIRWLCGAPPRTGGAGQGGPLPGTRLREIRCGDNWRFGRRAAGTPEELARYGGIYGYRVVIVPYARYQGVEISSTRIRYAVREGRLEDAAAMLGRPYSIRDVVVRGRGLGQDLCVATANLHPRSDVLPPNGVYAVRVLTCGAAYNGVANLGLHPTFTDVRPERPVLETHLLGFGGNLYGQTIEVVFLGRLREECVFDSAEALAGQIAEDIRNAARFFPEP
ncbi:MAG: riboflavin biosynthesis protein RibF [Kiritimatiellia bacterium]|jgi:riboflavin kinase/FMN adenylyltransferase|nr:riboflavin biosynthesis protein RibF [Kiritimatiellia bacterium]